MDGWNWFFISPQQPLLLQCLIGDDIILTETIIGQAQGERLLYQESVTKIMVREYKALNIDSYLNPLPTTG